MKITKELKILDKVQAYLDCCYNDINESFDLAAEDDDLELCKAFLRMGADISYGNPIYMFAVNENFEAVKWLVENGGDILELTRDIIDWKEDVENQDIVEYLEKELKKLDKPVKT